MRGAGNGTLCHFGQFELKLEIAGRSFSVHVEVTAVRRAILSVSKTQEHRFDVSFARRSGAR